MKTQKFFKYLSMVVGILVTLFLLLLFGFLMIEELIKEGPEYLIEILKACTNWYDNPTGFFFAYLIGYAVVWWKPLWGSVIIIFSSIFYVIIAGIDGPPIFAVPTFLVGLFYLIFSLILRKNKTISSAN